MTTARDNFLKVACTCAFATATLLGTAVARADQLLIGQVAPLATGA